MGWLPEIGDVVLGKYRVVRALGQGGMGVVFEAVNLATDGHVALKMLKPTLDGGAERSSRMGREARASAKLRSRFVARAIDFDYTEEGAPVLVMELLEGRDLSAELRRTPQFSVEDTVSYVIQACAGVGEAHALGIIHRDLKPGNLFLDDSGGTAIIRVLDFGLSKDLETDRHVDLTSPSDALGTLAYMSPEQMRATKDVGPPTDVWALGIVLYRVLMGKLPVTEKSYAIATRLLDPHPLPRVDREDVPRELADIIECALEKKVARRFPDARALGNALRPFLRDPTPVAKLALEELGAPPPSRPSLLDDRATFADGDEADTTRTVVSDAMDDRTSIMGPPPRRKKRKRHWLQSASKETRMVLMGSGVLTLATILIAATSVPRRPAAPPAVAAPPPIVAAPTYTPPVVTIVPAIQPTFTPAPSVSAPPRPRPKPGVPAPHARDDENPVRL